jgi:hypothetical protein
LVERTICDSDARGAYAAITSQGQETSAIDVAMLSRRRGFRLRGMTVRKKLHHKATGLTQVTDAPVTGSGNDGEARLADARIHEKLGLDILDNLAAVLGQEDLEDRKKQAGPLVWVGFQARRISTHRDHADLFREESGGFDTEAGVPVARRDRCLRAKDRAIRYGSGRYPPLAREIFCRFAADFTSARVTTSPPFNRRPRTATMSSTMLGRKAAESVRCQALAGRPCGRCPRIDGCCKRRRARPIDVRACIQGTVDKIVPVRMIRSQILDQVMVETARKCPGRFRINFHAERNPIPLLHEAKSLNNRRRRH